MSDPNMKAATENMQMIAQMLDRLLNGDDKPPTVGFTLLLFNFGDNVNVNYVSNAERRDMIVTMKELLARFEGQPHVRGTA